jgi:hypothetical protein
MEVYHLIPTQTAFPPPDQLSCVICGKHLNQIRKDWEYFITMEQDLPQRAVWCSVIKKEPDVLKEIYG